VISPDTLPGFLQLRTQLARSLRIPDRELRSGRILKIYALDFLQMMYSQPKARKHWDADPERTEILIVDKYTFNLKAVQKRPAIVANRGPAHFLKASGLRKMKETDLVTNTRTFADLIEGTVTLSCFSKEGEEAEDIALDVFEWFNDFSEAIRIRQSFRNPLDRRGFFRVDSVSIGEEALVKTDSKPDLSVVPVQIRALVERHWMLSASTGKLKNIKFTLTRGGVPV
jgi:hypothetical protein